MNFNDMIIKLIAIFMAIRGYAKNIHYSVSGKTMYGEHIFADVIEENPDNNVIDEIKEIFFLGRNFSVPDSAFLAQESIKYYPSMSSDDNFNWLQLRNLIAKAIFIIEQSNSMLTVGESNLIGGIAQELQKNLGLLNLRLGFPILNEEYLLDSSFDEKENLDSNNGLYSVNNDSDFKEDEHPRDQDGKFTSKGSEKSGGSQETSGGYKKPTEKEINENFSKLPPKVSSVYKKAIAAEESITKSLQDVTKGIGSKLAGLDFRTKTPKSTARKVISDAKEKGITVEECISSMYDLVRYTQENTVENFVDNYKKTMRQLESENYKIIQVKNTFNNPMSPYKGLNLKMQDAKGNKFELQFHTAQSLEVKEEMHKIYEEIRLLDKSDPKYSQLNKKMFDLGQKVIIPKGIDEIKNCKE